MGVHYSMRSALEQDTVTFTLEARTANPAVCTYGPLVSSCESPPPPSATPRCHNARLRTADTDCPPAAEGVGDRVGLREMVGVELLEGDEHAAPYSVWQPSRQYSGVDPHQPFLPRSGGPRGGG